MELKSANTASVYSSEPLSVTDEINILSWASSDYEHTKFTSFLSRSSRNRKRAMFELKSGAEQNLVHIAAQSGSCNNLLLMLATLKDLHMEELVDASCKHHMTPLHYAANAHQRACVKLLIDSGANVNALNLTRNTPLHLAAVNFQLYMLPSWNSAAYECIKMLALHPEMNLSILNLENQSPLGVSPNQWIKNTDWDPEMAAKVAENTLQVQRSQQGSTESPQYFCGARPVHNVREIICPRLSTFELIDCKILEGHYFDVDSAEHFVLIKAPTKRSTATTITTIARELEVLHHIRTQTSALSLRLVNLSYETSTTPGSTEYLTFPYITLDLNSFFNYKSTIIVGLMFQAIDALQVLHSLNIMHGDIKPHNFGVRVRYNEHFQVMLQNFEFAAILGQTHQGEKLTVYYPDETEYFKYMHPWTSPEVYAMHTDKASKSSTTHALQSIASLATGNSHTKSGNKGRIEAALAIDVFSLGMIIALAVDVDCYADRNKLLYAQKDMQKVLTSQYDLTQLFRKDRCREDPEAKKLLDCAVNLMCLIDPAQRWKLADVRHELLYV